MGWFVLAKYMMAYGRAPIFVLIRRITMKMVKVKWRRSRRIVWAKVPPKQKGEAK